MSKQNKTLVRFQFNHGLMKPVLLVDMGVGVEEITVDETRTLENVLSLNTKKGNIRGYSSIRAWNKHEHKRTYLDSNAMRDLLISKLCKSHTVGPRREEDMQPEVIDPYLGSSFTFELHGINAKLSAFYTSNEVQEPYYEISGDITTATARLIEHCAYFITSKIA